MKRPFSVTEEPKRTILENKIVDFVKENCKEIGTEQHYSAIYHRFLFVCPCCKKEHIFSATGDYSFDIGYKDGGLTNKGAYWFGYQIIKNHLAQQIRMNGSKKAMDLILKIFGRKYGKEVLLKLVERNILATKLICEYINKKFVLVGKSVAGGGE